MIPRIILLTIILSSISCAHSGTPPPSVHDEAINKKIHRLMADAFGDAQPTASVFYSYWGRESEDEYALELNECEERWGGPVVEGQQFVGEIPQDCKDWLAYRYDHADEVESLYLSDIRSNFLQFPLGYVINDIQEVGSDFVRIEVFIPKEKKLIVLIEKPEVTNPENRVFFIRAIN